MFENTNIRDKYDDLNILFYVNDASRKASFLTSILYDNLDARKNESRYVSDVVQYDICTKTTLDIRLHKDYYSVQSTPIHDDLTCCTNDKLIHSEIRNFGFEYNTSAAAYNYYELNNTPELVENYSLEEHNEKKKQILELIHTYQGNVRSNHDFELDYFKQQLIKQILVMYDDQKNEITAPSEWNNCDFFIYKQDSADDIKLCDTIKKMIDIKEYRPFFNRLFPNLFVVNNENYNPYEYFNYNITSEFLHDLLEKNNRININVSSFFTDEDSISCKYFRTIDQLDKLWMIDDATGVPVDVSYNSASLKQYMKKISTQQLCNDVGYKNAESCTTYLTNCIFKNKENDINKCKNYMLQSNYWNNIKSEIEHLNPELAQLTLERFGFKIINEYDDNAKQHLNKFQTYTTWLTNLHTISLDSNNELSPEEYTQISDNIQLKGYLNLLVNKINSNPSILNTNYICKTNNNGYNRNQFNDTQLFAYGLKSIDPMRYSRINIKRINTHVNDQTKYFLNLVDRVLINHPLITNIPPTSYILYNNNMQGGHNLSPSILSEFNPSHEIISDIFNGLNNHLKSQNKQIHPTDLKEINNLLENLSKSETKLVKVISYLEKYFEAISLYKNYDSNNVLSIDHIRTFSDKTKNTSQILSNTHDKIFLLLSKFLE